MSKLVKLFENKNILVADIKKNHILNIIEQAKKCNRITKIILFGSSLEERCTEISDIDIAVFQTYTQANYLKEQHITNFMMAY